MRYPQVFADKGKYSKWITPKVRGYRMACCDCGLVHELEFMAIDRKNRRLSCNKVQIKFRIKRNNRATAAIRRGSKTTPRIVLQPL